MSLWSPMILVLMVLINNAVAKELIIYVDNSSPDKLNSSLCWEEDSSPCATLELGLQGVYTGGSSDHTLMIASGTYQLNTSDYTQFESISNLKLQGYDQNGTVIIRCSQGVGFSFIKSSNIHLENIVFEGCGQLRTSTSFNLNPYYPDYVSFIVTLYFLYCRDITLNTVTVQNTLGTGTVIYNTIGTVSIDDCSFVNNQFQPDSDRSGGGGLYIEFSYCDPLNKTCLTLNKSNVNMDYTRNTAYFITNTLFHSNRANISQSNITKGTYILPYAKYHNAFGRGGGASIYLIGNATNVTITFNNCSFTNNSALWGAGMLVEFHDNAHYNYVFVKNSSFKGNYLYHTIHLNAGTGGGGVRIAMFMFPDRGSYIYNNNVIFTSCNFTSNTAYYGGGFSYYTTLQSDQYKTNHLQLFSCTFTANIARLGAAIDLSIFHPSTLGISPNIILHDVFLYANKALYHNKEGAPVGIGVVYVDTLHVRFEGTVTFKYNNGSALVLSGCHIHVNNNTRLSFIGNLARSGGAIVLYGGSFIVTHPGSFISFVRNIAEYYGGAIYNYNSGVRDQFGSGNCFLRFSDIFTAPDKWLSKFYFEGNLANGDSNSIYTSSVLPCVWGSAHGTTDKSDSIIRKVFCWSSNWEYRNSSNDSVDCYTQISTAPSKYNLTDTYSIIPGDTVPIEVVVWDDMSNVVTERAVFVLKIDSGPASFSGSKWYNYSYESHQELSLDGIPNSNVTLQVETDNPIILESQINVTLKPCPPGFYPVLANEGSKYPRCICDDNYDGHIHCNQSNFTSSVLRTGWIGNVPGHPDTTLLFGTSLYIWFRSAKQYLQLPQDPNDLSEFLCGSSNRMGVICGSCKDGYGVAADYLETKCVECPPGCEKYTWVFYLLTEIFPVTLFFGIVFLFSMTVTFGPLNSYVFFAQIITTVVNVNADGEIYFPGVSLKTMESIYDIPYAVWNLDFFRTVLPRYCLHPSLNSLAVLNITYIQVIYLIALLLLFVSLIHLYGKGVRVVVCLFRPLHRCLARFRQWTNLRQSVTGGMAVLVVIAYTKFVLLALYNLTPVHLIYPNGTRATTVFYLNGDVRFNAENIQYIIPSIVVLLVAAVPTVLLAYPSLLGLLSYISCKRLPLARLYPSHKLQAFLDEFHGCYKDGSNGGIDCRWFASFYFCLRVVLIVVFALSDSFADQFTVQTVVFISTAVLFTVFQPYRKSWLNKLDTVMFLLMAAISSLSNYNMSRIRDDFPPNMGVLILQYILVMIPLLYCIGYYMTLFCMKNKTRIYQRLRPTNPMSVQVPPLPPEELTNSMNSTSGDIYQSALVDSTHVPNFIDFIEGTGRMRQNVRLNKSHNWRPSDVQRRGETAPLIAPPPNNNTRRRDRGSTGSTDYQTPPPMDSLQNHNTN